MEDNAKNLIGTVVEVFTNNGGVKEIVVKDVFMNSSGKLLIEDNDGDIYFEDDINWRYKLTLGSCLMIWLDKFGYIDMREEIGKSAAKYEEQLKDLFAMLEKQGYLESHADE